MQVGPMLLYVLEFSLLLSIKSSQDVPIDSKKLTFIFCVHNLLNKTISKNIYSA